MTITIGAVAKLDGEEALIEHALDLSMSRDPVEAARGRYLKTVAVALMQWLDAEEERGTLPEHVGIGLMRGMGNEIVTYAINEIGPDARRAFAEEFCDALKRSCVAAVEQIP